MGNQASPLQMDHMVGVLQIPHMAEMLQMLRMAAMLQDGPHGCDASDTADVSDAVGLGRPESTNKTAIRCGCEKVAGLYNQIQTFFTHKSKDYKDNSPIIIK